MLANYFDNLYCLCIFACYCCRVNNIEQYIDDIIKLDDEFYDPEYMWDNDYQLAVYKRNKNSFKVKPNALNKVPPL